MHITDGFVRGSSTATSTSDKKINPIFKAGVIIYSEFN